MSTTTARRTNVPDYTTAYYFLEGLSEIGIDYLFCNFGTDHAPIIEEMAHRKQRGEAMPGVVRCPHENTAAHMAAGYAFVTAAARACWSMSTSAPPIPPTPCITFIAAGCRCC